MNRDDAFATGSGFPKSESKDLRVIAELGSGGMARVFLILSRGQLGFQKLQVMKRPRAEIIEDPELVQMFLDEVHLAAKLNHPNVVQTNEAGVDAEGYFLTMEYLEGQSLAALVNRHLEARGTALPVPLFVRALIEALSGLHYAHDLHDFDGTKLDIIHRDMSPHNIFVPYSGGAKILDFGIAKTSANTVATQTGFIKGKLSFMAPEQVAGEEVDRRVDVYACGVMLWASIVGRPLWQGLRDVQKMQRIAAGEIPRPSSVNPTTSEELDRICMRALALRPGDRYPTAAAFRGDLEAYLATLDENATALDLGALTSELFAADRALLRAAVDRHIRRIRDASSTHEITPLRLEEGVAREDSNASGVVPVASVVKSTPAARRPMSRAPARPQRRLALGVAVASVLAVAGGLFAISAGSAKGLNANAQAAPEVARAASGEPTLQSDALDASASSIETPARPILESR